MPKSLLEIQSMTSSTYNYIREKFDISIEQLATGKGNVRERLKTAYMNFHTLHKDDFPLALQKDWEWIVNQMTKFGPVLEEDESILQGSGEITIHRIKNLTAEEIAQRIFMLYREMNENKDYF